jgi:hypothetical protein
LRDGPWSEITHLLDDSETMRAPCLLYIKFISVTQGSIFI